MTDRRCLRRRPRRVGDGTRATFTPPATPAAAADPVAGEPAASGLSGWTWVVVVEVGAGLVVGIVLVRVDRARPSAGS
jgi:hypothetical protein